MKNLAISVLISYISISKWFTSCGTGMKVFCGIILVICAWAILTEVDCVIRDKRRKDARARRIARKFNEIREIKLEEIENYGN